MTSHPIINPTSFLNKTIDNNTIRLCSILGIGAYGVVYLARCELTNRVLAVKLLAEYNRLSKTEIQLHAHVAHHENILSIKKVIKESGRVFIVMEYATGGDLFSAITQGTQGIVGNNQKIRHIFLQLLDAVQHCHQHGISHRDLKPENILLFDDLKVKLADFGLATNQIVSSEFGCGSTFYFSPECQSGLVKNNKKIKGYGTQQNDIWSLGVILINLVTGRNPWRQAHMDDTTFAAYTKQKESFFTTILPSISSELDFILQRIFCLEPAHRISLPELKWRIMECRTFLRDQPYMTFSPATRPTCHHHRNNKTMQPTKSVQQSILDYTNDFATLLTPLRIPSTSCSTSSSSSSVSSLGCPSTPPLSVSSATSNKLSHDALVDLIQASSAYQTMI
ncbi:kinase-like domain-containing protein [Halteromyces radiatus]|uniref:kinase-like domain-containing protein n=1 Tax=Halteromyces radiatus TaxID=101107 RepID=UPI00221E590E|nr:kinase-like domain-containing protein [Halteromyces radiatus]KAI8090051.1 kinase-like domain-containing protein [Halteromyces radiatus]